MSLLLKRLTDERISVLVIVFPIALLPFILAVTSYVPSMIGAHEDRAGDYRIVQVTDLSNANRMVQLKGSLIARSHQERVTEFILTLSSTAGSEPINLDAKPFVITYQDQHHRVRDLPWSAQFQGEHNGDTLFEENELVQLTIGLSDAPSVNLGPNTPFVLELSAPQGLLLTIQRRTPLQLAPIVDLDL
jgi:archaellin